MRYIKKKHRKGQIIFLETILVICTYLFLLGFMLSTFQIFHTKMVFNIAAYEGARIGVMVMDDKELAQDFTKSEFYDERTTGFERYNFPKGSDMVRDFCKKNCLAYKRINRGSGVTVYYTQPNNGVFVQCIVGGEIQYLFPMISPNFVYGDTEPIKNNITLNESCTMARRRIFRGVMTEDEE